MKKDPNVYSPYKAAHHIDKIQQMRKGEHPVPLQVQLIISDLCNHNCSFCAYRMEGYTSNKNFGQWDAVKGMINNNPNRMIPVEKCKEILDDCAEMGVKAMQFTGGGEPTVHPHHKELFQYTIDKGLDLALVSNGTVMREGVPEILAQGKWVRFSVDAGNAQSYAKIREVPESFFDKALNNIKKVVKAREKVPDSDLVIGVGFVVVEENWREIYEAVEKFSKLGVDNVRISAVFTPEDFKYFEKFYDDAKALAQKAKEDFETEDFKVFNLFGDRIGDLIVRKPEYDFCSYMHLNTYIGGDQKVYTCCNNAYNDDGEMGSLKDQRFIDYWLSETKKEKYDCFKASNCARCMFNNKNRFINYMLEDNPVHVNYI
jgi:wyosine [tRNA(Phe)-imidazoG37] synthetase (radical SAM superfamily)